MPGNDGACTGQLSSFAATGARPRTDAWDGVRVVATLEAAQQSLDKGGV